MKRSLLALALSGAFSVTAGSNVVENDNTLWITTDADAQHLISKHGAKIFTSVINNRRSVVAKLDADQLASLTSHMHHEKNRCGGYMVHSSLEEAKLAAEMPFTRQEFEKPTISHQDIVTPLIAMIEPNHIVDTIEILSNFTNRFYTTTTGIEGSNWLLERWQQEIEGVDYASARQISHQDYPQKSVEVTLIGKTHPEQIVVIGGHLDSTVGSLTTEGTIAPGADDDASGIATVTETLRLMIASGVQPDKTIKFYGYAAEEVGLRGSQDIANTLKNNGEQVVSVLQLDMTNHQGSAHDITFLTDYTDSNLTEFLTELLDEYASEISYDFDQCGYACSDHASWHNADFSAAMPAESLFADTNPNLHSEADTLDNSDPSATHASKFVKLAIAYLVETSLESSSTVIELKAGEAVENLESDYGEEQFFTFESPEEGKVTIAVSGPRSGDADLYVKYEDSVSSTNFDCRPFINGSNEICTLNKPAGVFNIMLKGYRNFDQTQILVNFEATESTEKSGEFKLDMEFGDKNPDGQAKIKLSWNYDVDDYFIIKRNGTNVGATELNSYVDEFEFDETIDVEYQVCTSSGICSEKRDYHFVKPLIKA
ncbi:aminopeptidase [Vibrio azureus]|uniref:Putative leucyl aminopeptidase n=1 Tax=Vibrio azureus NBRC 104587 TaxID=1219077 RepID=U3C3P8_9VIBR|nr:M20/M25/M40 family metallo-hydrolase [Vibrio azureus]AUI87972.1 aminopeptidase [Vibrio azureus]GAD76069.1 putative leucyl aminopeptidase [Vibrio azureus NBRC 104587]